MKFVTIFLMFGVGTGFAIVAGASVKPLAPMSGSEMNLTRGAAPEATVDNIFSELSRSLENFQWTDEDLGEGPAWLSGKNLFFLGPPEGLDSLTVEVTSRMAGSTQPAVDRTEFRFSLIEEWKYLRRIERRRRDGCTFEVVRKPLNRWEFGKVSLGGITSSSVERVPNMAPDLAVVEWNLAEIKAETLKIEVPKAWEMTTAESKVTFVSAPEEALVTIEFLPVESFDDLVSSIKARLTSEDSSSTFSEEDMVGTTRSFAYAQDDAMHWVHLRDRGGQVVMVSFEGPKSDVPGWQLVWEHVISSLRLGGTFQKPGGSSFPPTDGGPLPTGGG